MRYPAFEKAFKPYPIFSVKDIRKRYPNFDNGRSVDWQHKGFIVKLRRGYYCFAEHEKGEHFLYFAANKMYAPSYVSLESALAHYDLIPEGVFTTISVTTKNTAAHATAIGNFAYRHMKPTLFFGYRLLREGAFTIRIAEPEKVLLDYFYMNKLNTPEAIEAMRLNGEWAKELIDFDKLERYQRLFNSRILDKRMRMFNQVVHA